MGRAAEHRWYGDVAPWSEEQLEQYCRDMGFSPLQPEESVPTAHDDVEAGLTSIVFDDGFESFTALGALKRPQIGAGRSTDGLNF